MEPDPSKHRGFLFVLEGIDGAGKTVVCDAVVQLLINDSHKVVQLQEPTSESPWGKEIRERSPTGSLKPDEELELFIRDREWHVKNRISPALEAGKIVMLDRYFFATGAYQTESTGIPWSEILRRNREEINVPEPDIVLLLDVPAELGLKRVMAGRDELNVQFERLERLIKVREVYLEMSQEDSGHYVVVDATRPFSEVVDEVHQIIRNFIEETISKP